MLLLLTFLLSLILTGLYRWAALHLGWLDIPNSRSSHTTPVPRGAGLIFASLILMSIGMLWLSDVLSLRVTTALIGACGLMAMVGFLDDLRPLHWRTRFFFQALAAFWGIAWAGGLTVLPLGHFLIPVGWLGIPFGLVAVMWLCNMYNFMDGIDGLAASQAIFVSLGLALLSHLTDQPSLVSLSLFIIAACAGFLVWNWSPAKVFMGDAGATFLGMLFGLLLVVAANMKNLSAWACLILMGIFVIDATITLGRRALRKEKLTTPHRMHLFQHIAQRWGHTVTVLIYSVINIGWLLPWAIVAQLYPLWAPICALLAFAPLIGMAIFLGAGQPQSLLNSGKKPL